jgi:hypothetical protein
MTVMMLVTCVAAAADSRSRRAATAPASPHVVVVMADDLDVEIAETMLALGLLRSARSPTKRSKAFARAMRM